MQLHLHIRCCNFRYSGKSYKLLPGSLAPENLPSQKESSLPTIIFQGLRFSKLTLSDSIFQLFVLCSSSNLAGSASCGMMLRSRWDENFGLCGRPFSIQDWQTWDNGRCEWKFQRLFKWFFGKSVRVLETHSHFHQGMHVNNVFANESMRKREGERNFSFSEVSMQEYIPNTQFKYHKKFLLEGTMMCSRSPSFLVSHCYSENIYPKW